MMLNNNGHKNGQYSMRFTIYRHIYSFCFTQTQKSITLQPYWHYYNDFQYSLSFSVIVLPQTINWYLSIYQTNYQTPNLPTLLYLSLSLSPSSLSLSIYVSIYRYLNYLSLCTYLYPVIYRHIYPYLYYRYVYAV